VLCLLSTLLDLLDCRLLLVHQLCDLIVQMAKFDQILLDLADGSGTLQSSLTGIVGLASASAGNLFLEY
jgi:hypothetical protein